MNDTNFVPCQCLSQGDDSKDTDRELPTAARECRDHVNVRKMTVGLTTSPTHHTLKSSSVSAPFRDSADLFIRQQIRFEELAREAAAVVVGESCRPVLPATMIVSNGPPSMAAVSDGEPQSDNNSVIIENKFGQQQTTTTGEQPCSRKRKATSPSMTVATTKKLAVGSPDENFSRNSPPLSPTGGEFSDEASSHRSEEDEGRGDGAGKEVIMRSPTPGSASDDSSSTHHHQTSERQRQIAVAAAAIAASSRFFIKDILGGGGGGAAQSQNNSSNSPNNNNHSSRGAPGLFMTPNAPSIPSHAAMAAAAMFLPPHLAVHHQHQYHQQLQEHQRLQQLQQQFFGGGGGGPHGHLGGPPRPGGNMFLPPQMMAEFFGMDPAAAAAAAAANYPKDLTGLHQSMRDEELLKRDGNKAGVKKEEEFSEEEEVGRAERKCEGLRDSKDVTGYNKHVMMGGIPPLINNNRAMNNSFSSMNSDDEEINPDGIDGKFCQKKYKQT